MLIRTLLLITALLCSATPLSAQNWSDYPDTLASFSYSEQNLAEHWQTLTYGLRGPLPTADSLKEDARRWPQMYDYTQEHLQSIANTHPELAYLSEGNLDEHFSAYAAELRKAWSLLFNGRFQEARDLGLALGPAGYFPGLYAQALYATLIETDPDNRSALLEEVIHLTRDIMPMAPDHPMIRFGNAYGKARILEDLSATEALGTGYTSEIQDTLETLLDEDASNVYAITLLAGVQAGIIEKAGGFVARLTYGAKQSSVEDLFEQAQEISPEYPGVYYEYARAHLKMDGDDGKEAALPLLEKVDDMQPVSAEEALLIRAATRLRDELNR